MVRAVVSCKRFIYANTKKNYRQLIYDIARFQIGVAEDMSSGMLSCMFASLFPAVSKDRIVGAVGFFRNVNTLQLGCIPFTLQNTACSPSHDPQELQFEVTIPEASERTTAEE